MNECKTRSLFSPSESTFNTGDGENSFRFAHVAHVVAGIYLCEKWGILKKTPELLAYLHLLHTMRQKPSGREKKALNRSGRAAVPQKPKQTPNRLQKSPVKRLRYRRSVRSRILLKMFSLLAHLPLPSRFPTPRLDGVDRCT